MNDNDFTKSNTDRASDLLPDKGNPFADRPRRKRRQADAPPTPATDSPGAMEAILAAGVTDSNTGPLNSDNAPEVRSTAPVEAIAAPIIAPAAPMDADLSDAELEIMTPEEVEALFAEATAEYAADDEPEDLTPDDLQARFGADPDTEVAFGWASGDPTDSLDLPTEFSPDDVEALFATDDLTTDAPTEEPLDLTPAELAALYAEEPTPAALPEGAPMTNEDATRDLTPEEVEKMFAEMDNSPADPFAATSPAPEGFSNFGSPEDLSAPTSVADFPGVTPAEPSFEFSGAIDDIPAEPALNQPAAADVTPVPLSIPDPIFGIAPQPTSLPTPTSQLPPRGLPLEDSFVSTVEPTGTTGPATTGFSSVFAPANPFARPAAGPSVAERLSEDSAPRRPPSTGALPVIRPDEEHGTSGESDSGASTSRPTMLLGPGVPSGKFMLPVAVPEAEEMIQLLITDDLVIGLWQRIGEVEQRVIELLPPAAPKHSEMLDRIKVARNLLLGGKQNFEDAARQIADVENHMVFLPRMQDDSNRVGYRIFFFQVFMLMVFAALAIVTYFFAASFALGAITTVYVRMFFWTVIAGGIGGVLASLWSLKVHVTDRQDFDRQHGMWYILTPVKGMILGLFMFGIAVAQLLVPLNIDSLTSMALIIVVSIALGFQQNVFFDLLARVLSVLSPKKSDK